MCLNILELAFPHSLFSYLPFLLLLLLHHFFLPDSTDLAQS